MATAAEKLAESLEALESLQQRDVIAIRSADLTRTDRERLLKAGFLKMVMKGWYIASRPDETPGESTAWYTSFWAFMAQYLDVRFGNDWSLSSEQSLIFQSGNHSVPSQLLIRAPGARNKVTEFPHGTSILEIKAEIAKETDLVISDGLRLYTTEAALTEVTNSFFQSYPTDARAILASIPDASGVLARLLKGGHTRAAGRLAGAFRNIGNDRIANEIVSAMRAASHDVRENDPFERIIRLDGSARLISPHVNRIKLMWSAMKDDMAGILPADKPRANDINAYLEAVEANYVTDAYHSLSIEGYAVTRGLIERVRSGDWNPDTNAIDREHKNALAARGYWQAFQSVKRSVRKVLEGQNSGKTVEEDIGNWYRELFAPSVTAGIIEAPQLAGYRNSPVYIRRSMHVPPSIEAVRDCMPVFFELLSDEQDPMTRVILGHFIFVFIHPYPDGNGRTARFLMNVMLASAGYPWTVIRLEDRENYMAALETASVQRDIKPFAKFIADLIHRH